MDLKYSWSTILLMISVVLMENYVAAQNTTDDLVCPEGWTRRKDTCYQPTDGIYSYQEARDWCELFGGDLPIPASRIEAEFITYLSLSSFPTQQHRFVWIGCTDEAVEGVFRCVDDSLMPFTGWSVGQPHGREGEDGVALLVQPPVIHDLRFNNTEWLVCEKKDPVCPAGWTRHGTKCYLMISNTTLTTYHEGRSTCQLAGGDLPVLDSQEEAEFLIFFTMSHFVTVPDPPFEAFVWIGCTDQENEGVWTCVDNSTMTFVDWGDGQPQNRFDEDVAGLKLERGLIYDAFLTYRLWVVCEHALIRDVDECADDTLNDCHANATCRNTHSSFTCTCKDGFVDFSSYRGGNCVARARTCTLPQAPSLSHFENPRTLYKQGQSVTVTCDDFLYGSTSWQCGANGHWIEQNIRCGPTDNNNNNNNNGVHIILYYVVSPVSVLMIVCCAVSIHNRKRGNPRPMRRVLRSTTTVTRVTVGEDTVNHPGQGVTNPGYSPSGQCGPLSVIAPTTMGHPSDSQGQLNHGPPTCGTYQPGEGITNPGYFPPGQRGPLSEISPTTTGGPSDITTPTEPPPPYEDVD